MSEIAFNKSAILILTVITLITVIILVFIYYRGYMNSQERFYNSTNESWKTFNRSVTCSLENLFEVASEVSKAVKNQKNCDRVYSNIKNIGDTKINLEATCIIENQQAGTTTTLLCEVEYECQSKKITQIKNC